MVLDKDTTLCFIHNSKLHKIKCSFTEYKFESIPIYISADIDNTEIIQLSNKEILGVVGLNFKDNIDLDSLIWYNILSIYYKSNITMRDICLAYWIGFNKTINLIRTYENNEDNIISRIKTLENIMVSDKNISIPSQNDVLSHFNYVKINQG